MQGQLLINALVMVLASASLVTGLYVRKQRKAGSLKYSRHRYSSLATSNHLRWTGGILAVAAIVTVVQLIFPRLYLSALNGYLLGACLVHVIKAHLYDEGVS